LSKEEVDIIKRLTGDEYADKDMNPYEVKLWEWMRAQSSA
jgi:hypothetical protein